MKESMAIGEESENGAITITDKAFQELYKPELEAGLVDKSIQEKVWQ